MTHTRTGQALHGHVVCVCDLLRLLDIHWKAFSPKQASVLPLFCFINLIWHTSVCVCMRVCVCVCARAQTWVHVWIWCGSNQQKKCVVWLYPTETNKTLQSEVISPGPASQQATGPIKGKTVKITNKKTKNSSWNVSREAEVWLMQFRKLSLQRLWSSVSTCYMHGLIRLKP